MYRTRRQPGVYKEVFGLFKQLVAGLILLVIVGLVWSVVGGFTPAHSTNLVPGCQSSFTAPNDCPQGGP